MENIPLQRYPNRVMPPLIALLSFYGLIQPIGFTRSGVAIWPIEGGDGSEPVNVLDRLRAKREGAETAARALIASAEAEDRDLTDPELDQIKAFNAEISKRDAQITELESLEQRQAKAAQASSMSQPGTALRDVAAPRVQVTRNEATYRPGGQTSFLRDLVGATKGDFAAAERLHRNNLEQVEIEQREMREAYAKSNALGAEFSGDPIPELRDGSSTSATQMGSYIPPVWLVNELAQKARVGRVLAPFMRDGGFPTTTSITIPRVTTGASVAGQAGDNAAASETDQVTAQLTRTTVTIAGQQDVSIQSLDLSPYPVDQFIFADLEAAYQAELDRQILRGSGTNELLGIDQVSSIGTVAYTDASPTVAEAYPKLASGWSTVATNRFLPPDIISMHPRRWAWFLSATDSTGRPLIMASSGPIRSDVGQNTLARYNSEAAQGMVGEMFSVPIVSTASHSTALGAGTEDQIIMARSADMILMESPRRTRILQEVLSGNLTVRLQLYSYVNFFAGRFPGGIARVYDTGFIAPTF